MAATVEVDNVLTTNARSLPGLVLEHAAATPTQVAMRKKALGRWREYTWQEYAERVSRIARGLLELGVDNGDCVAIHADNRPAWPLFDMATQAVGAITVGIYPTSPAAEVEYLLGHSEAKVAVVENQEQLDKTLAVREKLPRLEKIVVIDPAGLRGLDDPLLMTMRELEELGSQRTEDEFVARVERIDPTWIAIVVYTSGTTGPPKGAMLTHANLLASARASARSFGVEQGDDVLSYLPLCHIAERLISVINAVAIGYRVNFPESPDTVPQDLQEIQPTFFLGVPRVWEKFMAGIEIRMQDASRLKRWNHRFWMERGRRLALRRIEGRRGHGLTYFLGWLLLYRSVRKKLGLARVREALSGAAPIAPQVLEYFWSLGIDVREGYGQTEGTALGTLNPREGVRIGSVGKPLVGVVIRIAADGEILLQSPGVFVGYLKDPRATAEAIDSDGWLHTGDVGMLDEDGYLRITDRMKDIIITSGGKNIAPAEIENRLKVSPYVKEAIVVGDRRKYLTALIGIEFDNVANWASKQGLAFTTYGDLASKPEVRQLVQDWVDEVNLELAQVETIKKIELLPKELDQEEGELTATQKVKRAAIAREFGAVIDRMYAGA